MSVFSFEDDDLDVTSLMAAAGEDNDDEIVDQFESNAKVEEKDKQDNTPKEKASQQPQKDKTNEREIGTLGSETPVNVKDEIVKEEEVVSGSHKDTSTHSFTAAPRRNESVSFPNVIKEQDMIDETTKIIKVLDVLRTFNNDTKSVVTQFIFNSNDVPTDEASIVVKALSVDNILVRTMENIRASATEQDRVERVYYLLELPDNELNELGSTVGRLSSEEQENEIDKVRGNRIHLTKAVEKAINNLDSNVVKYVAATEQLLEAAK